MTRVAVIMGGWSSERPVSLSSGKGMADAAAKVPTRTIPDLLVRLVALFDPEMRSIAPGLGRKNRHTTAKAHAVLGWRPRPGADTVTECARSLVENGVA